MRVAARAWRAVLGCKRHLPVLLPLLLVMVGVIILRSATMMPRVFGADGVVNFLGVDPYYHMRLADYMLATDGGIMRFDPFGAYPDGVAVGYRPLLTLLIYWGTWVVTLGAPTAHMLDVVGAWIPPVLGALTIIPVYGIGKELTGSRIVGVLAAALVAYLPSEFFNRTLLGFTDHHALETLLTTTAMWALLRARTRARWAVGAGLAQAALYIGWHGAAMLTAVVCLGFAVAALRQAALRRPVAGELAIFMWYAVPVLIFVPFYRLVVNWATMDSVGMFAIVATAVWLVYLRFAPAGRISRWAYLAAPLVGGLAAALVAVQVSPAAFGVAEEVVRQLRSTFWGLGSTIVEAQPTLILTAWRYYGYLCIVLPFALFYAVRNRLDGKTLLWFLFVLAAALGQRRWNYLAVVPVAVLGVYALKLFADVLVARARPSYYMVVMLVLMASVFTQFGHILTAGPASNEVWDRGMTWLREQTPEPFDDADAYYTSTSAEPSYGVLSWWDYGHFIIRMGHRVPVSSPTWQEAAAQAFLLAQTPEEAEAHLAGLNIRYVLLTADELGGKFPAMAERLGYAENINAWQPVHANAQAVRMWEDRAPGWRLAFSLAFLRIYERVP